MTRLALTGPSGVVGRLIRPLLARQYDEVTLLDLSPLPDLAPHERQVVGRLEDYDAVAETVQGADCLVHLGGLGREGHFGPLIDANIRGTHHVLEAARYCGVQQVLIASSNHAVGGVKVADLATLDLSETRPASNYGVSKVAVEALCEMYARRYDLHLLLPRIGTVLAKPFTRRHLSTWLSPEDFLRLIVAAERLPWAGAHRLWATSANTRRWLNLAPGRILGFDPQDDSEIYAAEVTANPEDGTLDWPLIGAGWAQEEGDFAVTVPSRELRDPWAGRPS